MDLFTFLLHEKGGKLHSVPAHHEARELVYDYLTSADILEDRDGPLFRNLMKPKDPNELSENSMSRQAVFKMIKKRALEAGLSEETCCHSFRATGITSFLLGGGEVETAARIANHENTSTTGPAEPRNPHLWIHREAPGCLFQLNFRIPGAIHGADLETSLKRPFQHLGGAFFLGPAN